MRVIAGEYRSRLLAAPRGLATRPTSDRLRETLFNILAPRIAGSRFADLYAGSGAVGIEALSRGVAFVWFAENAPAAVRALKDNLAALNITANYALEDRGVAPLLASLRKRSLQLDLIFLDPPYEDAAAYTATLEALGRNDLLAPNALVLAEHARKSPLAPRYGALHQTRTHHQGDTTLTFFATNPDAAPS